MNVLLVYLMNKIRFFLAAIFLFASFVSSAKTLPRYEMRLAQLFETVKTADNDSVRLECNDSIKFLLNSVLQLPESFVFPFDSLVYVGKVTSDDKLLRVYTWNIVTDSGLVFNGFLQSSKGKIIRLEQRKNAYQPTLKQSISTQDWYGALYYRVVTYKYHKQKIYLLAGWSQCNEQTQYKVLDVLSFDNFGGAYLGLPIFFDEEKEVFSRAVFEYDVAAILFLDYQSSKKRFVFDHLSPMKYFEDDVVTLGPDMSFDAYVSKSKGWFLKEDIRVKNR